MHATEPIPCVSWEQNLLAVLLAQGPRAARLAACLVAVLVIVVFVMLIWCGATHQTAYAWDSAFLLDGAWRLLNGQRPHFDFYSPLGSVPLAVTALAMRATGPSANALAYGYAMLLLPVTLAAWWLSRVRLPAVSAVLFILLVSFSLVATHAPGGSFYDTTYAAQYNRLAWALLCLAALECLLSPRDPAMLGEPSPKGSVRGQSSPCSCSPRSPISARPCWP